MRIIAGEKKGRKLISPKDKSVRPTEDRIKESLFNIIANRIKGSIVLDLFSGSGSLGCEALSRGAAVVHFNELRYENYKVIMSNIKILDYENYRIYRGDFRTTLKKLAGTVRFDIIFIDPPYGKDLEYDALSYIAEYDLLNENALLVIESDKYIKNTPGFKLIDERRYGNTYLFFLVEEVLDDSNLSG